MSEPVVLTNPQAELLGDMARSKYGEITVRGSWRKVAMSLVRKGLAEWVSGRTVALTLQGKTHPVAQESIEA